jgi:hypothetical protein
MNVTITLLMYWSIAAGLIAGGLYALTQGFRLVLKGQGKSKDESSVTFLGMKATVGSIGSLVMITSFMWGWAARATLPSYKDPNTTIALRAELEKSKSMIVSLEKKNAVMERQYMLATETIEDIKKSTSNLYHAHSFVGSFIRSFVGSGLAI